jgi:hypothetical protein
MRAGRGMINWECNRACATESLLCAHHSLINQSPFESRSTNTTCPTPLANSRWVLARECWIVYRGPGFLVVVRLWLHAHPITLSRQQARPAAHRKTEKERRLADGRGGGANQMTARKPGPLKIIQYSLRHTIQFSQYPAYDFRNKN